MQLVKDLSLLRTPCERVSLSDGMRLGRTLHTFLLRLNKQRLEKKAVGLAAPQVGVYKRVCVINYNGKQLTLVNPEIVMHGSITCEFTEECLSLPGIAAKTKRYIGIQVNTTNLGITHLYDFEAAIAQHEIDHLNGILITDREEELENERLTRRQNETLRSPDYRASSDPWSTSYSQD